MLNIIDLSCHGIMLENDVETYHEVVYWLDYYRRHYSKGIPYSNGEGVYEGEYIIVRRVEGTKYGYRAIQ